MNYHLSQIPERTLKPRNNGMTMVMDKGLSPREVEDFIEVAGPFVDIVKLGWATSYVTPVLEKKLAIYKAAGIPVYFGGTLFEAFIIRNQYDDYKRLLDKFQLGHAEVSDGSIILDHQKKCEYISDLAKIVTVVSEVGSKDAENIMAPYQWIELMLAELAAGSHYVIAEARESGNVGIYRPNGSAHTTLIKMILTKVDMGDIVWETPKKSQQAWFIKQFGANVNLGNIGHDEVIPLETLRIGLRGDTFHDFLPEELAKKSLK